MRVSPGLSPLGFVSLLTIAALCLDGDAGRAEAQAGKGKSAPAAEQSKDDAAETDRKLDGAAKSLAAGDADAAMTALDGVLAGGGLSNRHMARALYLRGSAHRRKGRPAQAIADLTSAIWLKNGLNEADRAAALKERSEVSRAVGVADPGPAPGSQVRSEPAAQPAPRTQTSLLAPPSASTFSATGFPEPAPPPPRAAPREKAQSSALSASKKAAPLLSSWASTTKPAPPPPPAVSRAPLPEPPPAPAARRAPPEPQPAPVFAAPVVRRAAPESPPPPIAGRDPLATQPAATASRRQPPDSNSAPMVGERARAPVDPAEPEPPPGWVPSAEKAKRHADALAGHPTEPSPGRPAEGLGQFFSGFFGGGPARPAPPPSPKVARKPSWPAATTETASIATSAVTSGGYILQLAAVRSRREADAVAARVRKEHGRIIGALSLDIDETVFGNMGTFYRVRLGPFADANAPVAVCDKLRPKGYDCLIVAN